MEKFHQLRAEKVLTAFHIKSKQECADLDDFLSATGTLSDYDNTTLDLAITRYRKLGRGWNEEELKMHFISPILAVADPNIEDVCKTFFERPLEGVVNNYELSVVTDCMIASYNEGGQPVTPYFFLQEFKQSQRFGRTDPEGQMLAAMLLAAAANQHDNNQVLYGCFVIERQWYFTTLKGLDYCVSAAFDSTKKPDLLQIVFILQKLKELILARLR
jgi:hypothetical protein